MMLKDTKYKSAPSQRTDLSRGLRRRHRSQIPVQMLGTKN